MKTSRSFNVLSAHGKLSAKRFCATMAGYDTYYEVEDLFGKPYPELIAYMDEQGRGKVLDLGCGQGRDAIPLARMGFDVIGIDNSMVGINQMVKVATDEGLSLKGEVADIFQFDDFDDKNFVLMDSMFHFAKKDKKREVGFIKRVIESMDSKAELILCIQDTGEKVQTLRETIEESNAAITFESKFKYVFEDKESGHQSKTNYQMIVAGKRK